MKNILKLLLMMLIGSLGAGYLSSANSKHFTRVMREKSKTPPKAEKAAIKKQPAATQVAHSN